MENIEEKPAIDKFFYILNSQFTKRPMHFDRTAIEAILRMRGRLITEAEKETDSTNKELMIKEIERIDNNIAEYKTKCIQYFKEIDPELEGFKPYKSKVSKKAKIQNVITNKYPKAKWDEVLFKFPAESETISGKSKIGIKYKGENYDYFDFRELGLIKKNGESKREWTVFSLFVLSNVPKTKANKTRQKVYISNIRTLLKKITGINDDPFLPYGNDNEWKPKFRFTRAKEAKNQEYIDELKYKY